MANLTFELIENNLPSRGENIALAHKSVLFTYQELWDETLCIAHGLENFGLHRFDRVAIYLDKRIETVTSFFGTGAAGGVCVPINPQLKPHQVGHILTDSGARFLITSKTRVGNLKTILSDCSELRHVLLVDESMAENVDNAHYETHSLNGLVREHQRSMKRRKNLDCDPAAIMYTSGSTGRPKGVVLSHRNFVVGAKSVAEYLGIEAKDTILAVLPFSFDAGLSQLTTSFSVGAKVVLHNYLLPRDVPKICKSNGVTGISGVPPLWLELAEQDWPAETRKKLRLFTNTGGHMPKVTLDKLREIFPDAKPFLMYGLTEAFRSTYLDPSEIDNRPDSIGKAIPNVEVFVVNSEGIECAVDEVGELVHRGPLVSLGYWNDPDRTAKRFRPAPMQPDEISLKDIAVWSGDLVRRDTEGFLYFVGRNDEMIKTSGYRVSPGEIEEVLLSSKLVNEALAFGIPDAKLGQAIVVAVSGKDKLEVDGDAILQHCKRTLPGYMVPRKIEVFSNLPRNANGKLDRAAVRKNIEALL